MRQRKRPGLAALFDAAGADGPPRAYHLGFLIGPRINAGGRIGDAALGARLLTTRDDLASARDRRRARPPQSRAPADRDRDARRGRSRGAARRSGSRSAARRWWWRARAGRRASSASIAARLKERFERPAFALALERRAKRPARGARSPASISAASCARRSRRASPIKGGGHAMAAGRHARQEPGSANFAPFSKRSSREPVADGARRFRLGDRRRADRGRRDAGARAVDRGGRALRRRQSRADLRAAAPSPGRGLPRRRRPPAAARRRRATARRSKRSPSAPPASRWAKRCSALKGANVHLAGALAINRYGGREKAQLRVIDAAEVAQ